MQQQSTPEREKIYRFVKADDRTPKQSDIIMRLHGIEIRKGGWVSGSFCGYDAAHGWYPLSVRTSDIEWLEEISAPAASPVMGMDISNANRLLRMEAQHNGFDDFCEAHQRPYNDECPECLDIKQDKNEPMAPVAEGAAIVELLCHTLEELQKMYGDEWTDYAVEQVDSVLADAKRWHDNSDKIAPVMEEKFQRWESLDINDAVRQVTAVMREADPLFEKSGGSTRHYVSDLLLPMLAEKGLVVCKTNPFPPAPPIEPAEREFHCQNKIEEKPLCSFQCDHCSEYFKPLDNPALIELGEHVHVNLPSGGVARVAYPPDSELVKALDKMVELAKKMPDQAPKDPTGEKGDIALQWFIEKEKADKLEAELEKATNQLAAANEKIKELQEWHDSHA